MASYVKNQQKLQLATRMIVLYADFISRSQDKEETSEYYRLQCKWHKKADALNVRLKTMKRNRHGRRGA